jgi:hypothetical protein
LVQARHRQHQHLLEALQAALRGEQGDLADRRQHQQLAHILALGDLAFLALVTQLLGRRRVLFSESLMAAPP